jgi:hypothetical protein
MPSPNRVFFDGVRGARARFYLADFHVHSPGSIDFCGPDGKPFKLTGDSYQHDQQAISKFPVSEHYDALVRQRDDIFRETCSSDQDNSAIVAITDHNVCSYACALANHAWEQNLRKANRLLILPGMELTVTFPVGDEGDTTAHVLLAFAPETEDRQIFAAIREASGTSWDFGVPLQAANLPAFVSSMRHHSTYPAIVIAAHVDSARGVQKEIRKTILSRLDTAILHLQAALDCAEESDKPSIEKELDRLKQRRDDDDGIALEVLRLLGLCGFDAIQVAAKEDQHHYRRLHRCRPDLGRAVPIISSDAHQVRDVFHTRGSPDAKQHPFVKLPAPPAGSNPTNLIDHVRSRSLRYGETRFSCVPPGRVTAWIEAIEIIPDAKDAATFWPYKSQSEGTEGGNNFTLHFSQNLNCLIGGRGSGKSAALEAIGFTTCPSAFSDKEFRKQDWYKRATNTLKGCRLRVCWRILNAPGLDLKKNVLFVSRYFDPSHSHPKPVLTTLDEKELPPVAWQALEVEFFRLHDIETAAQPDKLRSLFDRFCGEKISTLQQDIGTIKDSLAKQRVSMLKVAERLAELTANHSALREYARRQFAYNEANREEIREQFEDLDNVEAAETLARSAGEEWDTLTNGFDLDSQQQKVESYFTSLSEQVTKAEQQDPTETPTEGEGDSAMERRVMRPYMATFASLLPQAEPSPVAIIGENIQRLSKSLGDVTASLRTSRDTLAQAHKESREALAAKGFPKGAADRQAKKKALDETEEKLVEYRALSNCTF